MSNLIDKMWDNLQNGNFQGMTMFDEKTLEEIEAKPFNNQPVITEAVQEPLVVMPEKISIFSKANPKSKNAIIKEWGTSLLKSEENVAGRKAVELTHKEIIKILKRYNHSTIHEVVRDLANFFRAYGDLEDFEKRLTVQRASKGKALIDKYHIVIVYEITPDGYVNILSIEDYHNYIASGEGIEETDYALDMKDDYIGFFKAFSRAYPVLPSDMDIVVDLSRIAYYWEGHTIDDVKRMLRHLVNIGWLKCVPTRINTGYNSTYQEFVITSYTKIPLLGRYGKQIVGYISAREGLFNTTPTQFEIDNDIELFRCPAKQEFVFTLEDGSFGFICNGDLVIFKETKYSTKKTPRYNISVETDAKKYYRFKDWYKYKKHVDASYKCKKEDVELEEAWQEKIVKRNVIIRTEEDLYNYASEAIYARHTNINFKGGAFQVQGCDLQLKGVIYDETTKWKDIITEGQYRDETEEEGAKRRYTAWHINNRIETNMILEGGKVSKDCAKYAKAVINEVNGPCEKAVCLTREELDEMPVHQVLAMDMLYTMIKSRLVWRNKMTNQENKIFKADILDEYLKGNYGKKIQIKEMQNKDLFINNRIKTEVNAYLKANPCNEDAQETILKTLAIKDYEQKCNILETQHGITIDLNSIKTNYVNQHNIYKNTINNIDGAENLNKLPFKVKVRVRNIVEEYNNETGIMLDIQSLKMKTVSLIDEVVEENNNLIEQLDNKDEEQKELKQTMKEINKTVKQLKRALKKDLLKTTEYRDYKSAKSEIIINDVCNKLNEIIPNIINSNITSKFDYDISKLTKLYNYVKDISERKYEIKNGTSYSKNYRSLKNSFCTLAA